MTMMDAKQVIAGLRRKNTELKATIEDLKKLMIDVCEDYGKEICAEGLCDGDPGWEGCLTRKTLEILGVEA